MLSISKMSANIKTTFAKEMYNGTWDQGLLTSYTNPYKKYPI